MEYAAAVPVTIVVYLLIVTLVINIFELLRRKVAREPNANLSGVIRDALEPYRSGRE